MASNLALIREKRVEEAKRKKAERRMKSKKKGLRFINPLHMDDFADNCVAGYYQYTGNISIKNTRISPQTSVSSVHSYKNKIKMI